MGWGAGGLLYILVNPLDQVILRTWPSLSGKETVLKMWHLLVTQSVIKNV